MLDAGPGAHDLHLAGMDHGAGPEAVPVLERPFEHIAQDLHVTMTVGAESTIRLHPVVVDDPQRAEAHVRRVVVVAEREGVATVEPVDAGAAALVGGSNVDHAGTLGQDWSSRKGLAHGTGCQAPSGVCTTTSRCG